MGVNSGRSFEFVDFSIRRFLIKKQFYNKFSLMLHFETAKSIKNLGAFYAYQSLIKGVCVLIYRAL